MFTILLVGEIVVAQSKINDLERLVIWVNQNIERFYIPMHDPVRMQIIQTLNDNKSTCNSCLI